MDNKVVLVTGAGGLLGRHLLTVASHEFELHAMVRREPEKRLPSVFYHRIDLAADWKTTQLPQKLDVIIHLAQSAKFRDFPNSALDVFQVNIDSTARLLDYARRVGVSRFIYASSGGVYGRGGTAFCENSPIAPPEQLGYYLSSKMCSEMLVQSYAPVMRVVVLRPFFIYGPGQNRGMLIPRLMDNVAAKRPVILQGADGIRINPIHVQDASRAVLAALTLDQSATFNISGPSILSIREICEGMGRYLGRDPVFQFSEEDAHDLIGNNAAMCKQLIAPERKLLDWLGDVAQ